MNSVELMRDRVSTREANYRFWYRHKETGMVMPIAFVMSDILAGAPTLCGADWEACDFYDAYTYKDDKNGVKIYEHDIIKFHAGDSWDSEGHVQRYWIHEVVWVGNGFERRSKEGQIIVNDFGSRDEVIGCARFNPELMEEGI